MEQDEITATTLKTNATTKNNKIQRVQAYDIKFTYDKYYRTPKVWILGYLSGGTPLSTENNMFQDMLPEHVQQTFTIKIHLSIGTKQLSIHPCHSVIFSFSPKPGSAPPNLWVP
jgi:hypothetical protein